MTKSKCKNKFKIKKLKQKRFGICALVLFCHLCFGICHSLFAQEKIVAVVNNEIITQKDLDEFVNFMRMQMGKQEDGQKGEERISQLKKDLLQKLLEDRLLVSEARKSKIDIEESRIKGRIDEIRQRYPSNKEFEDSLKEQGIVLADLKNKIRDQMMIYAVMDAKVRSKITIRPSEVTEFYQKDSNQFKTPKAWELDYIIVDDQDKAKEISGALKMGQDLSQVAKYNSLDAQKLTVIEGQFRKDIEEIIAKMSFNEFSEPVKLESKFYIFHMNNASPSRQQSLGEAQNSIYTFLYNKKMQEGMEKLLDELKKQSYIKIL